MVNRCNTEYYQWIVTGTCCYQNITTTTTNNNNNNNNNNNYSDVGVLLFLLMMMMMMMMMMMTMMIMMLAATTAVTVYSYCNIIISIFIKYKVKWHYLPKWILLTPFCREISSGRMMLHLFKQ